MKKILLILLFIPVGILASSFKCHSKIEGKIVVENIENLYPGTLINIYDEEGIVDSYYSNNNQVNFSFKVLCNKEYRIETLNKYYLFEKLKVSTKKEEKNKIEIKGKVNPRFQVSVDVISYNQNIKPLMYNKKEVKFNCDSRIEINRLVDFLKNNKEQLITINSRTDSRRSRSYNLKLSKKRALLVKNYMIENGINASRIKVNFFGEDKTLNKCINGVKCNTKEHQQNNQISFLLKPSNKTNR